MLVNYVRSTDFAEKQQLLSAIEVFDDAIDATKTLNDMLIRSIDNANRNDSVGELYLKTKRTTLIVDLMRYYADKAAGSNKKVAQIVDAIVAAAK